MSRGRLTPEPGVQGRTLPCAQALSHLQDLLPLGLFLLRPQAQLGAKQRGWAGVIPRRGLRTPSAPSPNSPGGSRSWGRSPVGREKGVTPAWGDTHARGGHTRALGTPLTFSCSTRRMTPNMESLNCISIFGAGSNNRFVGLEESQLPPKPPPSITATPRLFPPPHSSCPGHPQPLSAT